MLVAEKERVKGERFRVKAFGSGFTEYGKKMGIR
jgi:hypothetical protein